MKNNPQISRVLEIFWLIVFVITLGIAIYDTLNKGLAKSYMFYIMSSLALLMYFARRGLRRNVKKD